MDVDLHIKTGPIPEEHAHKLQELRALIAEESIDYRINEDVHDFVTDRILHHFLIARKYDINKACAMLKTALEWRGQREPHNLFKKGLDEREVEKLSHEAETGKIQLAGRDKYDREVVIFDNSVQNTSSSDGQLNYLAWNLEMAIHTLPPHVDKYVVFMHLENFSVLNSPPYHTTKETILMLTTCYPERLGHCICYQGPSYFHYVFNLMKSLGLIDPRTLQKVIFIHGDVSDGSPNDLLMTDILGPHWKDLTAAEADVLEEGCSPGFLHSAYWPWVLERWGQVLQLLSSGDSDEVRSAMSHLSLKIPARADMQQDSSGSESYSSEEEGGGGPRLASVSVPPKLTIKHLLRDPVAQIVLVMRPLVNSLKYLLHLGGTLYELADEFGDTPLYGTVTVRVLFGTVASLAITFHIIRRFFSTIYKTALMTWNALWRTLAWFGCAFDLTGTCQRHFYFRRVVPFVVTIFRLVPFVLLPLMFVVFLQMYNEAKDAESTWFENVESGLELMSTRAASNMKSTAKRLARKARRAERRMMFMARQGQSIDYPANEEYDNNGKDEDGPDSDFARLSISGKIRSGVGKKADPGSPRTPSGDKVVAIPRYFGHDSKASDSGEETDESGGGHEDSTYHVVGQGGQLVHGEAARRLSFRARADKVGVLHSSSAPVSRNTSGKDKRRHHRHHSAKLSTEVPPEERAAEGERQAFTRAKDPSGTNSPTRAEFNHLPQEDRPMELDEEDLVALDGY